MADVITQRKCLRCGYEWYPTTPEEPTTCANPKCRSPYWNTPRKTPRRRGYVGQ